ASELALERADLAAERRLRDAEPVGRAPEVRVLRERDEVSEVTHLHRRYLASPGAGIVTVLDVGPGNCVSFRPDERRRARARAVETVSAVRPSPLLIVDRHVDTAESMQLLLEAIGHRVHLAHDAATALDVAVTTRLDAAFLAINLPDLDGYELARRLRALGR